MGEREEMRGREGVTRVVIGMWYTYLYESIACGGCVVEEGFGLFQLRSMLATFQSPLAWLSLRVCSFISSSSFICS